MFEEPTSLYYEGGVDLLVFTDTTFPLAPWASMIVLGARVSKYFEESEPEEGYLLLIEKFEEFEGKSDNDMTIQDLKTAMEEKIGSLEGKISSLEKGMEASFENQLHQV